MLRLTNRRFGSLLSEPGSYKPEDCGLLFGRTFLKSMMRDASDDQKLKALGQQGGRPSTSSAADRHSRSINSRDLKSDRTGSGSGFTLHGNFNKLGSETGASTRGSRLVSPHLSVSPVVFVCPVDANFWRHGRRKSPQICVFLAIFKARCLGFRGYLPWSENSLYRYTLSESPRQ